MPRRNHPRPRRVHRPEPAPVLEPERRPSRDTQAMARELVRRGLASPLVLGHTSPTDLPDQPTESAQKAETT